MAKLLSLLLLGLIPHNQVEEYHFDLIIVQDLVDWDGQQWKLRWRQYVPVDYVNGEMHQRGYLFVPEDRRPRRDFKRGGYVDTMMSKFGCRIVRIRAPFILHVCQEEDLLLPGYAVIRGTFR